ELLAELRCDVVHVHHWLRLTRDLVVRAARAGVPGVVTLHDMTSTCLIYFRVRPGDLGFCEVPLAPEPCIDCAAQVFLATPWLARAEQVAVLERMKLDLARELRTARAVVALSADQARTLERLLGLDLELRVVTPASDVRLAPAQAPPPFDVHEP